MGGGAEGREAGVIGFAKVKLGGFSTREGCWSRAFGDFAAGVHGPLSGIWARAPGLWLGKLTTGYRLKYCTLAAYYLVVVRLSARPFMVFMSRAHATVRYCVTMLLIDWINLERDYFHTTPVFRRVTVPKHNNNTWPFLSKYSIHHYATDIWY